MYLPILRRDLSRYTWRITRREDMQDPPMMDDIVSLTEHVLDVAVLTAQTQHDGAGAISSFLGTTRDNFEGKSVVSLEYEAYDSMALEAMRSLCKKMRMQWELKRIVIQHKIGACPVGHASVFIGVSAAHRLEAIQACEYAINELKATVPVWKKELYGSAVVPVGTEPAAAATAAAAAAASSSSFSWKANKEFVTQVPLHLLPTTKDNAGQQGQGQEQNQSSPPQAAAGVFSAVQEKSEDVYKEAQKRELLSQRLKDKLRKSACDDVAGEGGAALLQELNSLWQQDSLIDEIGVVMTVEPGTTLVLCSDAKRNEHKLGIPVSAMKPLFAHSVTRFAVLLAELRQREREAPTSSTTGTGTGTGSGRRYGSGTVGDNVDPDASEADQARALVAAQLSPAELSLEIMHVTRAILVVRGDMPTALNVRKRLLLQRQDLADVDAELLLLAALFTLHPKSPSGWQHRRWCLCFRYRLQQQQQGQRQGGDGGTERQVSNCKIVANMWSAGAAGQEEEKDPCVQLSATQLDAEYAMVNYVNKRYVQNYYAWMHRVWVLKHAACGPGAELKLIPEILLRESAYTCDWLRSHTSDHCAVNYFVQIVQHMCEYKYKSNQSLENSVSEAAHTRSGLGLLYLAAPLGQCRALLLERPGSEALWCLQRSLLNILLAHLRELLGMPEWGAGGGGAGTPREEASGGDFVEQAEMEIAPNTTFRSEEERSRSLSIDGAAVAVGQAGAAGNAEEVDPAKQMLTRMRMLNSIVNGLSFSEPASSADVKRSLLAQLELLAGQQMDFARHCCTDISVWNFQQHRLLAMRYGAFCLNSIRSFALQLVPETHRFCVLLSEALQHVCGRLAVEDTFERAWLALK